MPKFKPGDRVLFQGNPGNVVELVVDEPHAHYSVALERLGKKPEFHDIAEANLEVPRDDE